MAAVKLQWFYQWPGIRDFQIDQRHTSTDPPTRRPPTFIFSLPSPAPPHCPASPRLLAALSPVPDRRRRDPALPVIRSRRPSTNSPNNNSSQSRQQIKSSPADPTTRPLDRLVAAATPASSPIQRQCADCASSASPRPPDHSSWSIPSASLYQT